MSASTMRAMLRCSDVWCVGEKGAIDPVFCLPLGHEWRWRQRRRPRTKATFLVTAAFAVAVGLVVSSAVDPPLLVAVPVSMSTAAETTENTKGDAFTLALVDAGREVDRLTDSVDHHGFVVGFGRHAERLVRQCSAVAGSGTSLADSHVHLLQAAVDARLEALFRLQLQNLRAQAVDHYEAAVQARPNPLEASLEAEQAFLAGASDLVRPGSGWSFEAEHRELVAWLHWCGSRDARRFEEQGKRGRGKLVTVKAIGQLEQHAANMRRLAQSRGAPPWDVRWDYTPGRASFVGFRGQYAQGRSVVEMMFKPNPDPGLKQKGFLKWLGPLNLAVAFDLFT